MKQPRDTSSKATDENEAETISFASATAFEDWLAGHYSYQPGVWMKMAKVSSGIPSVTSDEAVDIGLCWGWISGQRKSLDEQYYLQKYVPRRPHSIWSQVNVEKVAELTAAGKMRAPGLAEVEAAKADGRWQAAYISQRNAEPPEDLAKALSGNEIARQSFQSLSKTEQYMIILQLAKTRTAKGRAEVLDRTIADLARR